MKLTKIKSHWNERWLKLETEYLTRGSNYFISDYGRIKAVDKKKGTEKLIKGSTLKTGHKRLSISLIENKSSNTYIHKFVAENFVEKSIKDEEENRNFVDHIDGDKENNHFKNLRWLNQNELTEIQRKRGFFTEEKIRKKLPIKMTETKVKLLRKRLKEGKTKKKILARTFNISVAQIKRIESGENWGHIPINK